MTTRRWFVLTGLILAVLILFLALQYLSSRAPEPKFSILLSDGRFQLRSYPPLLIAQVKTEGSRKQAINDGFRILARYIFGQNSNKNRIEMTAPVLQESSQHIDMRAPVRQTEEDGTWIVSFIMPEKYTLQTLPRPIDHRIEILAEPARQYAVVKFSGLASDSNIQKNLEKLSQFISKHALEVKNPKPIFAFYNPPWIIPFLRRNEILIETK